MLLIVHVCLKEDIEIRMSIIFIGVDNIYQIHFMKIERMFVIIVNTLTGFLFIANNNIDIVNYWQICYNVF